MSLITDLTPQAPMASPDHASSKGSVASDDAGALGEKVTAEMIKAGLECALTFPLTEPSLPELEQMVAEVFLAMLRARR